VGRRLIRLSTRATGERVWVRVWVYDDLAELRDDAARFSPREDFSDALGVCQTYFVMGEDGPEHDPTAPLVIRLWRGALSTRVVAHEVSHAAAELYGRTLDRSTPAVGHLHAANETLAYLHGDLTSRLVDRLYALGYYDRAK